MMWTSQIAAKPNSNSPIAALVAELVPIDKAARAYFGAKGAHNPIISDLEYAKEPVAPESADYRAQNPGIPDYPFGKLYSGSAIISAHHDLAAITVRAAEILYEEQGWNVKVMDCLRTIEAQEGMVKVVKANGWSEDYVSSPGTGPHPRGMAIDLVPVDAKTGALIDMGTEFDHFGERSNRDFAGLTDGQKHNREKLNDAMTRAASNLGMKDDLEMLPSEWWDFRFKKERFEAHPALSDKDLPNAMRLTDHYPPDKSAGRSR